MALMRISQLAERSGVPATTLRFYEDAGLLPADRTAAGYRLYGDHVLARPKDLRTRARAVAYGAGSLLVVR